MKLYVGNLSYSTTQEALESAFAEHGRVDEVAIVMDRETDRPRGFAFVTMNNEDEARAAIDGVHGREIDGRTVTVNEARPKAERSGGRSGGGGGRRW
jgi:RNA recognition motif-containing protein